MCCSHVPWEHPVHGALITRRTALSNKAQSSAGGALASCPPAGRASPHLETVLVVAPPCISLQWKGGYGS